MFYLIRNKLLLIELLFLIIPYRTLSQAPNISFHHITNDTGISQNTVDYIYKDSRGYMWFATWNGLNRYDGYSFKTYNTNKLGSSLTSNYTQAICEDSEGNLWIGTENGLNVLDYQTNEISTFYNDSTDTNSISGNNITGIICDENGTVWVGTYGQGLNSITKIDGENYIIQRYSNDHEDKNSLSNNIINVLYLDEDNSLWIGTDNGLNLFNKNNHKFARYNAGSSPNSLSHGAILSICKDTSDLLWIGTWNGLNKLDPQTGEIKQYNNTYLTNLSNQIIKAIKVDLNGNLLVGTLNGLYIYLQESDSFSHISINTNNKDQNIEFINCIETDEEGNVWIGTEMGGVFMYNIYQKRFSSLPTNPFSKNNSNNNVINSLYSDTAELWIGTAGNGLNRYNKQNHTYQLYKNIPGEKQCISGDFVSALNKDKYNRLWIGTWGNGLNILTKRQDREYIEQLTPENGWNNTNNVFVSAIYTDSNLVLIGGLWGLEIVDLATKKFIPIANRTNLINKISDVQCIIKDVNNNFWIGSRNGLYCINKSKIKQNIADNDIVCYRKNGNQFLPNDYIISLCEDRKGNIWAGTFGSGISKIKLKENKEVTIINYNSNDGLSNDVVYAIVEDNSGDLWFSTDYGLSKFITDQSVFKNYYQSDGLNNNQFYWRSACKGKDGKLYFGGISGINLFDPESILDNNIPPSVTITDFKVFNKSTSIAFDNNNKQSDIHLSYKQNVFSFEFSALVYFQSKKIKYAYKMSGVDRDWVTVPYTKRFANYTNLKGGQYTFLVKASNGDGIWSDTPTQVNITVTPPFYDTLIFKLLLIASITILIVVYFKYRTRILIIEKKSLEDIVEKRTHEIALQKEKLSLNNKQITEQRDKLVELNKKVQLVNQYKLRFFTNISHEFRTPLTLISGPVNKLLQNNTQPEEYKDLLQIINRNTQRLTHLINQLLDFRKIETAKLSLKVSQGDLGNFITGISSSFEHLAKELNIQFSNKIEKSYEQQWFDYSKIENIIFNLLSNAFKYTPTKGTVKLELKYEKQKNKRKKFPNTFAIIKVIDSGNGIPTEQLENIFKRFYQVDTSDNLKIKGSGIGLSLTKELVAVHHGNITVSSQLKKGTIFTISIPCEKACFKENEISEEKIIWNSSVLKQKIDAINLQVSTHKNKKYTKDKPLVLIVEDNHDLRQFLTKCLITDYSIIEAKNGKEGYEATKIYNPAIIISDIMMPEMDGLEMCTKIKNNLLTSHIPVILLTAKSMAENWIEGLETGADDYVSKPFDINILEAKVKNILITREKLRQHFSSNSIAEPDNITTTTADKDFIEKAMDIVERNYQNPEFGVKNLVDQMYVSRSLLHKKLIAIVNQSAGDFITSFRLKKAAILLRESEKNISEIAYEVGFNDPKYFSQKFKRYFGIKPSQYSKNKPD